MPVEVLHYMLSAENRKNRLVFQLILQCAPFFKRMKIACMANIEKGAGEELPVLFQNTGIEYFILEETKSRDLIFFFRREEMASYLMKNEIREFLETYRYDPKDVNQALRKLSERISQGAGGRLDFPHEIGVFLNYPVEDVKGFIEERGRNSLLSGYWKVYDNPGRTQMIFSAYDRAKQSAVNEFLSGIPFQEIVMS